ncbi:unnamed protein product [Lathyrus oleraceus]
MDKGKGGNGETSDPVDHSNRNNVTPAIADGAFLAEEDEDYNELYRGIYIGDIYIGPGSLQPLPINKDSGVKNNEVERKKPPPPPQPQPLLSVQNAGRVSLPGTSGIGQKQPFVVGESTWFFLGGLHWWTKDADVEYELCKYGEVREVRYFCDKASGKFRGYCQVEFYDPLAAASCQKGLIGHEFNGRPCIVSSTLTRTISTNQHDRDKQGKKKPDEVEATKRGDGNGGRGGIKEGGDVDNQGKKKPDEVEATKRGDGNGGRGGSKEGGYVDNQGKKKPDEVEATKRGDGNGGRGGIKERGDGNGGRGGIKERGDGDNRGYGRGNWGRGNNLGMGNRGHGNPVRNLGGGMGGRSTRMGGPTSRMGGQAGFPGGPKPPFPRILPSYPRVGLRGGPNMGMRPGPDMGRWGGRGKVAETSYGEEAAREHQYNEVGRNRGGSLNAVREKDRGSERDFPRTCERPLEDDRVHAFDRYVPSENDLEHDHEERRNLDDREVSRSRSPRDSYHARSIDHGRDRERGWNRDRHSEDRDRYADHHGFTDHARQHNDEQERGRPSRTSIKSRLSYPSRKYTHNGKRR